MKITLKSSNSLSPDLRARLAKAKAPKAALEAIGLAVISLTQRAFTQASLRPQAWAPLKAATLKAKKRAGYGSKPLISTGALAHSPRITAVTSKTVSVGSDRRAGSHSLAAIHQLGGKDGSIPARPFFPFDKAGKPTPRASKNITSAARRALDLERKP